MVQSKPTTLQSPSHNPLEQERSMSAAVANAPILSAVKPLKEDMHPIAQRIEQAKNYKEKLLNQKISWSGLSQAIGFTATAPNNWKKGKISKETLEKIADYTEVSFAWLVTGSGEMLSKNNNLNIAGAISGSFAAGAMLGAPGILTATAFATASVAHRVYQAQQALKKVLEKLDNEDSAEVEIIKNAYIENETNIHHNFDDQVRLVPIISFVQAGNFREAILSAQDHFVASYAGNLSGEAFALEVAGDSMAPEFKHSDKIIVDPNVIPQPGDYVIAQNEGHEATFKKYRPRGYDEDGEEFFELVPLNENYPILNSKVQKIKIIGTVVEHIRALRRQN